MFRLIAFSAFAAALGSAASINPKNANGILGAGSFNPYTIPQVPQYTSSPMSYPGYGQARKYAGHQGTSHHSMVM